MDRPAGSIGYSWHPDEIKLMKEEILEQRGRKAGSRNSIGSILTLFGLWTLLSGKLGFFHLGIGALAVGFTVWLQMGLAPMRSPEAPRLKVFRVIFYVCWLVWKMIESAIQVSVQILKGPKQLDPVLIKFRSEQPSVVNGVVFANSITLTPGTLTVGLRDNCYLVHALRPETAEEVLGGEMARRVAWLSSDQPIPKPERINLIEEDSV